MQLCHMLIFVFMYLYYRYYRPQTKFGARLYFHKCLSSCSQGGMPQAHMPPRNTQPQAPPLALLVTFLFLTYKSETYVLFQLSGNNVNFDIFISLIVSTFRRGHIKFGIILLNIFTQGIINLIS